MSIYRRKGSDNWWIHVEVRGQSVRRSAKTKDKRKAEELEAHIRSRLYDDLHNSQLGRAPRRTFGEALRRWLDSDARTLKSYDNLIDKAAIVDGYLNKIWLSDVPDHAQRMKEIFIGQRLKPATINRRLAIVRRVMRLAFEWKWLDSPLAGRIKLLSGETERHEYLTREQIDALAMASGVAGDAVLFLAYTGLRKSEMFSLTEDNRRGDMLLLTGRTKGGKPRAVPVPSVIAHLTLPLKITEHQLRTGFETGRQAIGKPGLRLHDLRHSYASLLVQAGVGLTVVRDLLGHAHLGVTSRYAHLEHGHLTRAAQKLTARNATQRGRNKK